MFAFQVAPPKLGRPVANIRDTKFQQARVSEPDIYASRGISIWALAGARDSAARKNRPANLEADGPKMLKIAHSWTPPYSPKM
jgi:hypothetical protein